MFITNVVQASKPKAKTILVLIESLATGHKTCVPRDRLGDKVEIIRLDPWVRQEVVYKEVKKLKSIREKSK